MLEASLTSTLRPSWQPRSLCAYAGSLSLLLHEYRNTDTDEFGRSNVCHILVVALVCCRLFLCGWPLCLGELPALSVVEQASLCPYWNMFKLLVLDFE